MSVMSYASAPAAQPLIGETIGGPRPHRRALAGPAGAGRALSRTCAGPGRSCSTRVDAFAAGLLALGLEPGDRVGIWSPNNAEWVMTQFATAKAGLILVNINPAYRLHRAGIRAEQGRLPRAGHRRPRSRPATTRHARRRWRRNWRPAPPGRLTAARLPPLEIVIQIGGARIPGMLRLRRGRRPLGDGRDARAAGASSASSCSSTTRSTSSSPPAPPARPRARRSRTTTSSTTASSSARRMRFTEATGSASRCRSTTASAW